jgi:hypothetical protein
MSLYKNEDKRKLLRFYTCFSLIKPSGFAYQTFGFAYQTFGFAYQTFGFAYQTFVLSIINIYKSNSYGPYK